MRLGLLQLLVDAAELLLGFFVAAVVAAQVVEQVVLHLALARHQGVIVGPDITNRVAVLLAGVHAQQQVVGRVVFLVDVVRVVGADDFDVVLVCQAQQHLVHIFLAFAGAVEIHQAVALNFDVVVLAEHIEPPLQLFLGFGFRFEENGLRNLGPDAAAGGNQALVVALQQLAVNAREFGVHALNKAQRAELAQVVVAGLVLGQQQLVVAHVALPFLAAEGLLVTVLHQVKLAAHNGLHVVLIGLGHEVERPKHVAVVGESHRGHAIGLRLLHQLADAGLAVEQRVLRVAVEVRENGHLRAVNSYQLAVSN